MEQLGGEWCNAEAEHMLLCTRNWLTIQMKTGIKSSFAPLTLEARTVDGIFNGLSGGLH